MRTTSDESLSDSTVSVSGRTQTSDTTQLAGREPTTTRLPAGVLAPTTKVLKRSHLATVSDVETALTIGLDANVQRTVAAMSSVVSPTGFSAVISPSVTRIPSSVALLPRASSFRTLMSSGAFYSKTNGDLARSEVPGEAASSNAQREETMMSTASVIVQSAVVSGALSSATLSISGYTLRSTSGESAAMLSETKRALLSGVEGEKTMSKTWSMGMVPHAVQSVLSVGSGEASLFEARMSTTSLLPSSSFAFYSDSSLTMFAHETSESIDTLSSSISWSGVITSLLPNISVSIKALTSASLSAQIETPLAVVSSGAITSRDTLWLSHLTHTFGVSTQVASVFPSFQYSCLKGGLCREPVDSTLQTLDNKLTSGHKMKSRVVSISSEYEVIIPTVDLSTGIVNAGAFYSSVLLPSLTAVARSTNTQTWTAGTVDTTHNNTQVSVLSLSPSILPAIERDIFSMSSHSSTVTTEGTESRRYQSSREVSSLVTSVSEKTEAMVSQTAMLPSKWEVSTVSVLLSLNSLTSFASPQTSRTLYSSQKSTGSSMATHYPSTTSGVTVQSSLNVLQTSRMSYSSQKLTGSSMVAQSPSTTPGVTVLPYLNSLSSFASPQNSSTLYSSQKSTENSMATQSSSTTSGVTVQPSFNSLSSFASLQTSRTLYSSQKSENSKVTQSTSSTSGATFLPSFNSLPSFASPHTSRMLYSSQKSTEHSMATQSPSTMSGVTVQSSYMPTTSNAYFATSTSKLHLPSKLVAGITTLSTSQTPRASSPQVEQTSTELSLLTSSSLSAGARPSFSVSSNLKSKTRLLTELPTSSVPSLLPSPSSPTRVTPPTHNTSSPSSGIPVFAIAAGAAGGLALLLVVLILLVVLLRRNTHRFRRASSSSSKLEQTVLGWREPEPVNSRLVNGSTSESRRKATK